MSAKLEAIFTPIKPTELTVAQRSSIRNIKTCAIELARCIHPADNREKSLAMTKLEEAVMWAVKGVLQ